MAKSIPTAQLCKPSFTVDFSKFNSGFGAITYVQMQLLPASLKPNIKIHNKKEDRFSIKCPRE